VRADGLLSVETLSGKDGSAEQGRLRSAAGIASLRPLDNYWGAYHEALEAQSVTPRRLAGSLFKGLQAEHRAFEGMYVGPAKSSLDGLGHIWHEAEARRYEWPDPALTHEQVAKAQHLFEDIYDSLVHQGQKFSAARKEILKHAPHGTPNEPLRADAAR
jgi:hypothetical protein